MAARNEIPPQERILIRSSDAADLLSLSYSDFRERVRRGEIPVAAKSGSMDLFSVKRLRRHFNKAQ